MDGAESRKGTTRECRLNRAPRMTGHNRRWGVGGGGAAAFRAPLVLTCSHTRALLQRTAALTARLTEVGRWPSGGKVHALPSAGEDRQNPRPTLPGGLSCAQSPRGRLPCSGMQGRMGALVSGLPGGFPGHLELGEEGTPRNISVEPLTRAPEQKTWAREVWVPHTLNSWAVDLTRPQGLPSEPLWGAR